MNAGPLDARYLSEQSVGGEKMMKRIVGAGCVVLVAFSAACTSETGDSTETESIGSTSQAVTLQCAGAVVKAFTGLPLVSYGLVSTYDTISAYDLKVNHIRAQSYFSYLMGGPIPPSSVAIGGVSYPVRDIHFSQAPGVDGTTTYAKLCALRSGIARGAVTVSNAGSTTMCGTNVGAYRLGFGYLDSTDCNNSLNLSGTNTISSTAAVLWTAASLEADRGWWPLSANGDDSLPTFFKVALSGDWSIDIDPEPVTLNAGQTLPAAGTYSSSTNAAATGNDTGAAYAQATPNDQGGGIFRWPSTETYAASTTQLALQAAYKSLGVPCFTPDQTGTTTNKYIRKGMMANKYLCVAP